MVKRYSPKRRAVIVRTKRGHTRFDEVYSVDAHGLGVLLEMRARMHEKGIAFELMNVIKKMMRVLEIARLDSVFES